MRTKRPLILDKICVDGEETTVLALALFQPDAPHFWNVTNSAGVDLQIEWRQRLWGVHGKATYAPKAPVARPSKASPLSDGVKSQFRPTKTKDSSAPSVVLSPEVKGLHETLDETRDLYYRARNSGDAEAMEIAWTRHEKSILAVDLADPGFFLGRMNPITPAPRYVPPVLDYAGISSRAVWDESRSKALLQADLERIALESDVISEASCRVCGCTEMDCSGCIKKTGAACYWVESDLCSACAPEQTKLHKNV